jgi:DNA-binding NtrC family response regulator
MKKILTTESQTFDFMEPAAVPLRPVNRPARILVLDDDRDLRELYQAVLGQNGYQVEAAADGQTGWAMLQARRFDLLITDHEMPELTGLDLVKKVWDYGMTLAVIFASGSLSHWELRQRSSVQIAAELPKPFSPVELVRTVQRVLSEHEVVTGSHPGPLNA